MSEENVEVVQQMFDATARGDSATALGYYHPEVVWDNSRNPLGGVGGPTEVAHGIEGIMSGFREWNDAWEHFEYDVEELIDAGEHVISVVTMRGRGRGSGVEVDSKHLSGLWTIRERKVVRVAWFPSRKEAVEAAGLSE